MTQWEYKRMEVTIREQGWGIKNKREDIDKVLTEAGEDGWELVSASEDDWRMHLIFKRPKQPTKEQLRRTRILREKLYATLGESETGTPTTRLDREDTQRLK